MPIVASKLPSVEELNSQINYNPNTGLFTWKINKKGPIKAGMKAGTRHSKGYTTIRINGVDYLAHRLAWIIFYGSLEENEQIDHINLDRTDNKICNLRKATHSENCRNTKSRSHNLSGLKGAHLDKRNGKYRARISIEGKQKWIGYFKTPEEAHEAYKKKAEELYGEFFRP